MCAFLLDCIGHFACCRWRDGAHNDHDSVRLKNLYHLIFAQEDLLNIRCVRANRNDDL